MKKQNTNYIFNYNKKNYTEFRCWLDKETYKRLEEYIKNNYKSKSEFLKKVIDLLNI